MVSIITGSRNVAAWKRKQLERVLTCGGSPSPSTCTCASLSLWERPPGCWCCPPAVAWGTHRLPASLVRNRRSLTYKWGSGGPWPCRSDRGCVQQDSREWAAGGGWRSTLGILLLTRSPSAGAQLGISQAAAEYKAKSWTKVQHSVQCDLEPGLSLVPGLLKSQGCHHLGNKAIQVATFTSGLSYPGLQLLLLGHLVLHRPLLHRRHFYQGWSRNKVRLPEMWSLSFYLCISVFSETKQTGCRVT